MSISQLVLDLKNNNEDYEFYPTTDEMLRVIAPYMEHEIVLDIGCGTCKFKKYMDKRMNDEYNAYESEQKRLEKEAEARGERHYWNKRSYDFKKINKYFVMEKSKILLQQLDNDAICIGTDLHASTLIDKKVSTIFCNPPYSEFKEWTKKIISEGNYKQAFLIIPQRWKDDIEIINLLKAFKTEYSILGSFDFLEADRIARAKVDVVRFQKEKYKDRYYRYDNQDDIDSDTFNVWFNDAFGIKQDDNELKNEKYESDYDRANKYQKNKKERIVNALVSSEDSKASVLVRLYNEEYNNLMKNLKAIMQLDEDILADFNLSVALIKSAVKEKMKNLKILYWDMVWNEFDEITNRLTYTTRRLLKEQFEELYYMDFNIENIYALILYVVKNANKYYDSQLIDFFRNLSSDENVKPYKSNQKLFNNGSFRYYKEEAKNYVLDYRIIASSPFRVGWSGEIEKSYSENNTLKDIFVIARNLGFVPCGHRPEPSYFGEKVQVYQEFNNETKEQPLLMDYTCYKNGNMHIRFNKEFMKALNVEVGRLLGWLHSKEDIAKELPDDMAKGAEKYFKTNYTCLSTNLLLLECKE